MECAKCRVSGRSCWRRWQGGKSLVAGRDSRQDSSMLTVILAPVLLAGDQLLVAAYNSDSVARHGAQSGAWISSIAAGGQDGVLGIAIGPDGALYVASERTDT